MSRILLVDDEPGVLYMLKEVLTDRGHAPVLASSGADALARLDGIELVVTDLNMPEMDGLQLLRALKERDESLPVILLTAHGSEKVAVKAMKDGAYDYCTKPFDIDEMALVVERALEAHTLRVENRRFAAEKALGRRIIGDSPSMRRILEAARRVAAKDITVLVRGETGSGKELVASLLHAQSRREGKPLIRFNCAAIPGDLAEAELFGHVKGAFTGAVGNRLGFFAQADGGTLVLDEVGELTQAVQAKLLRAIQEGEIQPVGSGRVQKVDVRIVACTNRDLAAEVKAGRFREDLYYRLAVVELLVPPLRERRDDVPALALEFARRYGERFGAGEVRLSQELLQRLSAAEWPGNVRELENAVARLVALSGGGVIGAEAFTGSPVTDGLQLSTPSQPPAPIATPVEGTAPVPSSLDEPAQAPGGALSLREQVEGFERGVISRALLGAGGNQSEAARRLGTSRVTLIDKIKKYGLHGVGTREE
jgi:two-component system, NtrC family, response regulator AtoC